MAKKDTGIVNIHGKEYLTVARRVTDFRAEYTITAGWGILTELVSVDESVVIMKASITNEDGRVIATGYAEENRTRSGINSTSALENAETSAIGRALAAAGFAGTEYASADEVAQAISHQPKTGRGEAVSSGYTSGASEKQIGFAKKLLGSSKLTDEQRRDGLAYLEGDRTSKEISAFIDRIKGIIGE